MEIKTEANAKALVEHWNWAAEKGLMNKNTAATLRAACAKVLGVLDNWEETDIKALDVEGTLSRFQNLRKKEFKPAVLETYKRRFRLAITSYLKYLDDPGGWKPGIAERAPRQEREAGNGRHVEATPRTAGREIPLAGLVEYPFPLREGQIARLILPRDLKAAEVKRLTAFMSTLVLDSEGNSAAA